jgi:hypothetical protein
LDLRRYGLVRQIDATHAMMENITYQMCTMTKEESAKALAGRVLHSSTIQLNLSRF